MLKALLPYTTISRIRRIKDIIKYWKLRSDIIKCLKKKTNAEFQTIADYLGQRKDLPVFPYAYTDKYNSYECTVYVEDGYPYVLHKGKKIYGPKAYTKDEWRDYYVGLLCEQDPESPHCYLTAGRAVDANDVVADVGAAEGIFALDIVEIVRKVYLFECDDQWIIPLQKTFAPWKDKVEFIHKYISDKTQADEVSLDDFFKKREITFLKADIEGAERLMLAGGRETFLNKIKRCLLCCYHLPDDRMVIEKMLDGYGYIYEENPGYMIFKYDVNGLAEPFLRKGVLYGVRNIDVA